MKASDLWEKDDFESMEAMIRIERFIKSEGAKAAHLWSAWYELKVRLGITRNGTPLEPIK